MESQNAETGFQRFSNFKLPYRESETKLIRESFGENKVRHSRGVRAGSVVMAWEVPRWLGKFPEKFPKTDERSLAVIRGLVFQAQALRVLSRGPYSK